MGELCCHLVTRDLWLTLRQEITRCHVAVPNTDPRIPPWASIYDEFGHGGCSDDEFGHTKGSKPESLDFWSEPYQVAVAAGKHIEGDVHVVPCMPCASICDEFGHGGCADDEFGHKKVSKPES